MLRTFLTISLISLFALNSFGQFNQPKRYADDYNQDGILDSMIIESSRGSGFYYAEYIIFDGKTKIRDTVIIEGCFCSILTMTPIPERFMEANNIGFRHAIEKYFFNQKGKPDYSLEWLIGAYLNPVSPLDSSPFRILIDAKKGWYTEPLLPPYSRYSIMTGDSLAQMISALYPEKYEDLHRHDWSKAKYAWLFYYGNNHLPSKARRSPAPTSFQVADSSSKYQLLVTAHGVVVKKKDSFRWLFVTDVSLTGAPDKMRWASISNVKLSGDLVIIHHEAPVSGAPSIFIADINTGKLGQLDLKDKMPAPELINLSFELQKSQLTVHLDPYEKGLSVSSQVFTFNLKELQKALNQ